MLLIRPLLRANAHRRFRAHSVIFFIFLVANIGGSLTPLGDPPLFLGFLKGVDFFWTTTHLLTKTSLLAFILLVIFFVLDMVLFRKEGCPKPPVNPNEEPEKFGLEGKVNLLFLLGIVLAVLLSGLCPLGELFSVFGVPIEGQNLLRDLVLLSMSIENVAALAREELQSSGSCLVVCNTKKTAEKIYALCPASEGQHRYYLSTSLCPAHRMALDENRNTRDYLYGRLLAVAEYIERTALDLAVDKRPTNAERLLQRFADHPFATWRQLELQLSSYEQRLKTSSRAGLLVRAQKVLQTIYEKFVPEDFSSAEKLSGEFLLGYHCQMTALYSKSEKEATTEATD